MIGLYKIHAFWEWQYGVAVTSLLHDSLNRHALSSYNTDQCSNITFRLLILFVGLKRRSYGTETVFNVPVSVPGPIRDGAETGAHQPKVLSQQYKLPALLKFGLKIQGSCAHTSLFSLKAIQTIR